MTVNRATLQLSSVCSPTWLEIRHNMVMNYSIDHDDKVKQMLCPVWAGLLGSRTGLRSVCVRFTCHLTIDRPSTWLGLITDTAWWLGWHQYILSSTGTRFIGLGFLPATVSLDYKRKSGGTLSTTLPPSWQFDNFTSECVILSGYYPCDQHLACYPIIIHQESLFLTWP